MMWHGPGGTSLVVGRSRHTLPAGGGFVSRAAAFAVGLLLAALVPSPVTGHGEVRDC